MIKLKNDSLSFSFPEIDEAIRRLIEEHINSTLPAIIAADRSCAVRALHSFWWFRDATPEKRQKAESQIINATPEKIAAALRQKSMSVVKRGRGSITTLRMEFQRTLRIPDDGKIYPLPAGFGRFPLRHVDDYEDTVPTQWIERGGVLMPMFQSEALWIRFSTGYPFAVKVAAGKINAVTGELWQTELQADPQNYMVLPEQPWLDGFAVRKGVIRQFVAMPLGAGYSAEEQITGKADTGGPQLQVFPLRAEAYFRSKIEERLPKTLEDLLDELVDGELLKFDVLHCLAPQRSMVMEHAEMGLGAGGTMRQEIFEDPHDFSDWDLSLSSRCFVHLCNSLVWRHRSQAAIRRTHRSRRRSTPTPEFHGSTTTATTSLRCQARRSSIRSRVFLLLAKRREKNLCQIIPRSSQSSSCNMGMPGAQTKFRSGLRSSRKAVGAWVTSQPWIPTGK
jgi:hypothetical protein